MVALFWKLLRGIPLPSRTRRRSGSVLFFRKSALTTQRSHLCFRNVYWSEGLRRCPAPVRCECVQCHQFSWPRHQPATSTLAPKAAIGRTAYSIVP
jgi:hypothetical protein